MVCLAHSYPNGAPLVAITGQVGTDRMQLTSHQYLDLTAMFEPITKRSKQIIRPDTVGEIVRLAFKHAEKGKPGATHIDLPQNIAKMADRLHIPVVNTMMAKGIIPMDDKYSLWTIGIPQKDYVNQLFDRADLVIAIGYDIVECAPAKWGARPDMTIPLFLFHLSFKAALPCRVTKKDALRSLAKRPCLLMLKV